MGHVLRYFGLVFALLLINSLHDGVPEFPLVHSLMINGIIYYLKEIAIDLKKNVFFIR